MTHILFVEDDQTIASAVEFSLTREGFDITLSSRVEDTRLRLKKQRFDLVLLDLGLPDGSGYTLCKEIHAAGDTPVIILSAKDEEVNIIMGLDLGADDYITKPFRLGELISRIKAVLRRRQPAAFEERTLSLGGIRILANQAKVLKNDQEVILTAMEYRLLLTLLNHQGQVLSRDQIFAHIWDVNENFVSDNTLTVYIKRLREKLEDDPKNPVLIKTVRGLGYMIGN